MDSYKRAVIAGALAVFISVSAAAAPEGRSESGDWFGRQISRIVKQLKKVFAPSALDEIEPLPPHP